MRFEDMLCFAPVLVFRKGGQYQANWSPKTPSGAFVHGRGAADTPYIAIGRAYRDALDKGWTQPA